MTLISCKHICAQSNPEIVIHENGYQMGFAKDGEMISDFSYDFISYESWYPFGMIVIQNGKYGVIDTAIRPLIPCKFDKIARFRNIPDRLYVQKRDKVQIVDFSLKEICPFFRIDRDSDFETTDFSQGPAEMVYRIRERNEYGYLNTDGVFLVPPEYSRVEVLKISKNGSTSESEILHHPSILDFSDSTGKTTHFFLTYSERGCQLINQKGEGVNDDFFFKRVYGSFDFDYLAVESEEKTRFIHLSTGVVSESVPTVKDSSSIKIVGDGHHYGVLGSNGQFTLPFEYSDIRYYDGFQPFYWLEKNHKIGLIDTNGNVILESEFDQVKNLCGWGDSTIRPIAVQKPYSGWAIYVWSSRDHCFIPRTGHVYSSLNCEDAEAGEIKFRRKDHKSGIIDHDWMIRWDYRRPKNRW